MRSGLWPCLLAVLFGACASEPEEASAKPDAGAPISDADAGPGAQREPERDADTSAPGAVGADASSGRDAAAMPRDAGGSGAASDASMARSESDGGCLPARRTFLNHGSEGFFACAASAEQRAQCWGEGFFSASPKKLVFKMGADVSGAVQFAAVGYNGCVLLDSGALHCWTSGDQSQARSEPVIARDVVQVSGGYHDACALVRPAAGPAYVSCFQVEQWTAPQRLALEATDEPVVIANGYKNGCVVLASGSIKCWGANGNGQLGSGPGPDSNAPKLTASLGAKAVDVTVGNEHVCALLEGGAVKCWGQYNDGKLGFAATQNQDVPGTPAIASGATALAAGKWHTCAIMSDETLQCWGKGPIGLGATPRAVDGLTRVVAVSGGRDYACAILRGGALKCWGTGGAGALGNAVPGDVPSSEAGAFKAALPACGPR